jgi:DNA-binding NtrC family response regulator
MARVLVVDDDDLLRETVVLALGRAHHAVHQAGDGLKALEILDRESVDVVVSDIVMPEVDGIGLILAMRKRHPRLRVVAMSGGGRTRNMDFLRMAGALGAHATLPKPFTPDQLLAAVNAALNAPDKP